ncbi:MAG: putative DNA binding domain-containing protein [Phascolarctobacterium sp.]|nr:putative DNA binding domain-containing protein [Phascolarctobacterium sp.]
MTDKLLLGESVNVEYKESVPEKSIKYMKTVVAFANGKGGTLVFGVEDGTMKVVGIDKEELFTTMDAISNAIIDSCEPMITPNIYVRNIEDKYVLVVEVASGTQTPYCIKSLGIEKGTYIRVGGTTRLAEMHMIQELILQKTNRYYDNVPARGKTLTEKEVEQACREFTEYAKENCDTEEEKNKIRPLTKNKLQEWGLLHEFDGELVPSIGLCLLLDIPVNGIRSMVRCAIFRGTDRAIFLDSKDYEGRLYKQIDDAYDFVVRNIRVGAEFVGIQRKDVYELPLGSIREAICNAVCHRSYLEDDDVKVALYDDRLEITSPGGLYNGVTLEKIRDGFSKTRNRGIANMLSYMRVIESWGSGIPRILRECKERGLPEPSVGVSEDYVIVQLFRDDYYENSKASDKTSDNPPETTQKLSGTTQNYPETTRKIFKGKMKDGSLLGEYEVKIINLVSSNHGITQKEVASKLGIDVNLTKYYFKKLKDGKVLEHQGASKNGKWIVNEELLVE